MSDVEAGTLWVSILGSVAVVVAIAASLLYGVPLILGLVAGLCGRFGGPRGDRVNRALTRLLDPVGDWDGLPEPPRDAKDAPEQVVDADEVERVHPNIVRGRE